MLTYRTYGKCVRNINLIKSELGASKFYEINKKKEVFSQNSNIT